ncbi:MAG: restriction endonuclease subunit S [Corynebacterium matruchotii]|uniref:restriction endonuclease subunit S n=1 Tax=Corynebacterium matruchotii TaxID=43768 RepID=UPI0036066419
MSEWPTVKLGDLGEFINGFAFKPSDWSEDGTPIIRIQNLTNPQALFNRTTKRVKDVLYVEPGDLLVSWSATLGVFRWQGKERAVLNQHIFKVVSKPIIENEFLEFSLKFALQQVEKYLHGATMRHVNRREFLDLKIPLPPLGEQKRIAEILGGASKAINAIRTEIKRVESLCGAVVSLYAEDQSTKKLEDLATLSGGLSLGSHRKNKPHSVGYLRVANVFWGKILYDEIKELNCTDQEFERTLLQDGDVLITEAHANRFQVGRSAVFRGEEQALVFQNHLFRARPNKNIDSDVLAAMLSSVAVRRQLYQMAKTTSGLNTISISQVRSLRVPVLDTTKQAELLSFLQESNKLNHLLHRKLSLLQELQKSLATRAFAGLL